MHTGVFAVHFVRLRNLSGFRIRSATGVAAARGVGNEKRTREERNAYTRCVTCSVDLHGYTYVGRDAGATVWLEGEKGRLCSRCAGRTTFFLIHAINFHPPRTVPRYFFLVHPLLSFFYPWALVVSLYFLHNPLSQPRCFSFVLCYRSRSYDAKKKERERKRKSNRNRLSKDASNPRDRLSRKYQEYRYTRSVEGMEPVDREAYVVYLSIEVCALRIAVRVKSINSRSAKRRARGPLTLIIFQSSAMGAWRERFFPPFLSEWLASLPSFSPLRK